MAHLVRVVRASAFDYAEVLVEGKSPIWRSVTFFFFLSWLFSRVFCFGPPSLCFCVSTEVLSFSFGIITMGIDIVEVLRGKARTASSIDKEVANKLL